jgi:SAM-dependent methyltransferase
MGEMTIGPYALLKNPRIYELVQSIFGGSRIRRKFADGYVRAKPGDRILDIGCGTAQLLSFLPDVSYVGYEPNADYVETARKLHPKALFFAQPYGAEDVGKSEPFDVVIVSAVLHHLDDAAARDLFTLLRRSLKPGGRVVTLDPVYAAEQNLIARLLISLDRGRNVRTLEGYRNLASGSFDRVVGDIRHQKWPPYTHWFMTAS